MDIKVERVAIRVQRALRSLNRTLKKTYPNLPSIMGVAHLRNIDVFRVSFVEWSTDLNLSRQDGRHNIRDVLQEAIEND